jgi:mono/diheme cytochrome c family protein
MRLAARRLPVPGAFLLFVVCVFVVGCGHVRGGPGSEAEVARPEEILAFSVLYRQNCAACHGKNGMDGAAISLANPVYLAIAGEDNLRAAIAKGVSGKLMPPFARSAGGTLTDRQVVTLAQGLVQQWGTPDLLTGQNPLSYSATLQGDAARGQQAFTTFCAKCHGASGEGGQSGQNSNSGKIGSIVDPAYLALVSDQYLRSITIAGRPDAGMPDWRSDGAQPLTDQQVTDIVAWIVSNRTANPGTPYRSHSQ